MRFRMFCIGLDRAWSALTLLAIHRGDTEILKGIDLQLQGGWTAIVGPNGAGNSTLLRALAGLL